MKTKNQALMIIATMLLFFSTALTFSQSDATRPEYITVTTMHWNMELEDFDMDEWKAVEKEYLEKVTKKNEHILAASFYTHLFSPSNTEVIYVQAYPSWDAIDKASVRNGELEKLAWPDEKARDAYFKKQGAYFSDQHSDEIYAPMSGGKLVPENNTKDLVLYVRKTHFAFPEDGSQKEFNELRMEGNTKVIMKNQYVKGYYPNIHTWGADRTEFVEAFFVDSMCDLQKMFDQNGELIEQAWPDAAGKERGKKWGKYFTGEHGDAAYTLIAELSK